MQEHGGYVLLSHYNNSMIQRTLSIRHCNTSSVLASLYSDVRWQLGRFNIPEVKHPKTQREFFDNFAHKMGIKRQEDWERIRTAGE